MENNFATFKPVQLNASPSKEEIATYYRENNITLKEGYLDSYFGLNNTPNTIQTTPVTSPKSSSKYDVSRFFNTPITSIPTSTSTDNTVDFSDIDNLNIEEKAEKVIQFFVKKGLTREQAAGIAGNIHAESTFNTNALGDNGASFGLAQWQKDRRVNLENYAKTNNKPVNSFQTQLEFLWKELQTTHKGAFDALKRTTTVRDAAKVFAFKFEKMKNYNLLREQQAQYYFAKK